MKKLITISLICCLVLAICTPVAAFIPIRSEKGVNAEAFTYALVDYINYDDVQVHNMTEYEIEICDHNFKSYDVIRTKNSLDFKFDCYGRYAFILWEPPIFWFPKYEFSGEMHVNDTIPQMCLGDPQITIWDNDTRCHATGLNWELNVKSFRTVDGSAYLYCH